MQQGILTLIAPADIISIINALFGFLAIMILSLSFLNQTLAYRLSLLCLFLGLLADGLDGFIARKTTQGPLGPYLESVSYTHLRAHET